MIMKREATRGNLGHEKTRSKGFDSKYITMRGVSETDIDFNVSFIR